MSMNALKIAPVSALLASSVSGTVNAAVNVELGLIIKALATAVVSVEAEVAGISTVLTSASVTALVNILLELKVTVTALEKVVASILGSTASGRL